MPLPLLYFLLGNKIQHSHYTTPYEVLVLSKRSESCDPNHFSSIVALDCKSRTAMCTFHLSWITKWYLVIWEPPHPQYSTVSSPLYFPSLACHYPRIYTRLETLAFLIFSICLYTEAYKHMASIRYGYPLPSILLLRSHRPGGRAIQIVYKTFR